MRVADFIQIEQKLKGLVAPAFPDLLSGATNMDRKQHWQHIYLTQDPTEVSWFQAEPTTSLRLLDTAGLTGES